MGELPDPSERRRSPAVQGTPLVAGGKEWLCADAPPQLGPVWDRLFDQNVVRGEYDPDDLRLAATRLLWANYHLTADEVVALVMSVDPADLVVPVEDALFGPAREHVGYSRWADSALRANGLDPGSVPASERRHVLDQLVATGRAVPASLFVTSVVQAGKRKKFLDGIRKG